MLFNPTLLAADDDEAAVEFALAELTFGGNIFIAFSSVIRAL